MRDEIEDARREGYDAGWRFHLGNGVRVENPYTDETMYRAWEDGFSNAGDDS